MSQTATVLIVLGGLALAGTAAFLIVRMKTQADLAAMEAQREELAAKDGAISDERRVLGGVRRITDSAFGVVEGIFEIQGV